MPGASLFWDRCNYFDVLFALFPLSTLLVLYLYISPLYAMLQPYMVLDSTTHQPPAHLLTLLGRMTARLYIRPGLSTNAIFKVSIEQHTWSATDELTVYPFDHHRRES